MKRWTVDLALGDEFPSMEFDKFMIFLFEKGNIVTIFNALQNGEDVTLKSNKEWADIKVVSAKPKRLTPTKVHIRSAVKFFDGTGHQVYRVKIKE